MYRFKGPRPIPVVKVSPSNIERSDPCWITDKPGFYQSKPALLFNRSRLPLTICREHGSNLASYSEAACQIGENAGRLGLFSLLSPPVLGKVAVAFRRWSANSEFSFFFQKFKNKTNIGADFIRMMQV